MWWKHQNLELTRTDTSGEQWHFRVWHDIVGTVHEVRILFWNEKQDVTGIMALAPGANTHVRAVRAAIQKLTADPKLRNRYQANLSFPVERYYPQNAS